MVGDGILIVFFLWLSVLSYFLWTTRKHYFSLTRRTGKHNIDEILDSLLQNEEEGKKKIKSLEQAVEQIIIKARSSFQKIGLVRFNAFGRTGTDQSFVLALLDKNENGMILNFIYTHDGVRIYTKRVKKAEGEEYQLSEEEKRAIKESK